jgi:hypothetical protein
MSRLRIAAIVLVAAVSSTLASPVRPQFEEWELVAKLCGRLERTDRVPDKVVPGQYSEKNSPIKDAKLVAYEARSNAECCSNAKVAAETVTNKSGSFEFKTLTKGYYWLATTIDKRDYRMSIRIGQLQDRQPVCSQMSFSIDGSGEMALRIRAPGR